jgi:hypothetical protein
MAGPPAVAAPPAAASTPEPEASSSAPAGALPDTDHRNKAQARDGEADSREAEAPEAEDAEEQAKESEDSGKREGWDRSTLRIGLIVGVASAVVTSVLGYLGASALTTTHPSTVQALELAGAVFGGAMFGIMVIVSVQSVRAIRTASWPGSASEAEKHAEDDKDEKEPEETPYDFVIDQRERHQMLIWLVPITLALGAVGYVLIKLSYPGIADTHRTTPLDRLGIGIGGFLALLAAILLIPCVIAAWPAGVYGPKNKPHLWVLLLRLAGYWLAMTPFSLFSLGAIGLGIYQGLDGAWAAMIFLLIFGFACGVACCYLLAGSGALRGVRLKAGGEVPERVRATSWWRHFKRMLSIWATFATVIAIVYLIKADWSDFRDAIGAALVSWFARAKAGTGEMPEDVFTM